MNKNIINIDCREFSTKGDAILFFRQMLYRYEVGQMVDRDDHRLLLALIQCHPNSQRLLGCAIARFRIAKGETFSGHGRRFEIIRDDGSVDSFSYLKCIQPPTDTKLNHVLRAMRLEVIEQTRAFYDDAHRGRRTIPCGITGEPIKRGESHIDHTPPLTFQRLVASFLREIGLTVDEVAISSDGRCAKLFADRELAAKWQAYHREHARLRITSKKANLGQKKVKVDFSGLRTQ